ncbi:low-density lipoprotein receptor-related protein 11 isoform X2 [Sitophilus oryzae]|uniref:Low-density lipoprotein receptor-related protein 11 isoform X2 n=1 Tax=Sitophilus oryzae TaxID=7048 RepID=A0A6J2Y8K7_SITOR|nr:low-density lipoprotein receptor-related protein 11 isoform X2 [Sitophilus oryzae]
MIWISPTNITKYKLLAWYTILCSMVFEQTISTRSKRSEIDLQTCIDNFNVHRDKIIRTQDSQNMGAKYLNEIDLGSREECLRLCCETEDCDVFVFEEKNSGSCYLFHCGPPEDFKCKFTHHVNYSSAVLSINRHLPDLESQIKLTKHVQELTKLRKPESDTPELSQGNSKLSKPPTTLAPVITKEVLPMEKQTSSRKCSRFQFECRSTGECIAIYNACDGIPQCADGSDEAHELGCPAVEAVASAAAQTSPPVTTKKAPASVQPPQPNIPLYGREGELVQQPVKPHTANYQPLYPPQQQQQVPLQQDADFLRPVPDVRNSGRAQYVPAQNYLDMANPWNVVRQPQVGVMPQGVSQYQDNSAQIYGNKDAVSHMEGQSQMKYQVPGYYGENYRQPIQQENWPIDPRYPPRQLYHDIENPAAPGVPDKTEGSSHVTESIQTKNTLPKPIDPDVNSKHVQEKLAHDLKHSKENMEHGKIKTKSDDSRQDRYPDVVAYKMNDTQDGPSRIPRGAILSLTLGLIITAVMAILIGCRLRVVRRRLRKGGKGYAHDADYLVNGMYL